MLNVYEQIDRNKRRSAIIVALFAIFVAFFVYILGRAYGYSQSFVVIALLFSGVSSFSAFWFSDKIILATSQAKPADPNQDRLFYSVAQNLAIGTQVPMPKLYVIDDTAPNAFATGRDINHAVVCATTGLLAKLDRTELEGVLAHEFTHIKNYDMRLMTIVSVMVGMIVLVSDWLLRSRFRSRNKDEGNLGAVLMIVGLVLLLLSPLIAQLIQLAISRRREFLADAGSAMITRQPDGLIRALQKISDDQEPLEAANKATADLYIINPFKNKQKGIGAFAKLFNTHPPVEERIKALKEMIK